MPRTLTQYFSPMVSVGAGNRLAQYSLALAILLAWSAASSASCLARRQSRSNARFRAAETSRGSVGALPLIGMPARADAHASASRKLQARSRMMSPNGSPTHPSRKSAQAPIFGPDTLTLNDRLLRQRHSPPFLE